MEASPAPARCTAAWAQVQTLTASCGLQDAYTAYPFLVQVPATPVDCPVVERLPPRLATQHREADSSPPGSESGTSDPDEASQRSAQASAMTTARNSSSLAEGTTEALHFFGVFDGHGGAEAAAHCAQTLHQRIAEALSAATSPSGRPAEQASFSPGQQQQQQQQGEAGSEDDGSAHGSRQQSARSRLSAEPSGPSQDDPLSAIIEDSLLEDADEPAAAACPSTAERFEAALTTAFSQTDEDFGKADNSALVGTTAVVALVGQRQMYVANCGASLVQLIALDGLPFSSSASSVLITKHALHGSQLLRDAVHSEAALLTAGCCAGDSRAVLCRGDLALPLSDDHKAAREDETVSQHAESPDVLLTSLSQPWLNGPDVVASAARPCCRFQLAGVACCSLTLTLRWPLQARVEALGGQILFWNGVRVMGVLAVSRAIGDHCLRPFVIAQPEVRVGCFAAQQSPVPMQELAPQLWAACTLVC